MSDIRILGISGSLRAGSLNTGLLLAAGEELPPGAQMEVARIDDLPLYNADLEDVVAAERLKAQIAAADAVLIASPEYNYSIPGPLKNAIDWASRPGFDSVFRGKLVGIIGASGSPVGTARGQAHLKNVLLAMVASPFPWREVTVGGARSKFEEGKLVDDATRQMLREYVAALVERAAFERSISAERSS